jgi:hypothetical protein
LALGARDKIVFSSEVFLTSQSLIYKINILFKLKKLIIGVFGAVVVFRGM